MLPTVVSTAPTKALVFAGAEAEEEPYGERGFDAWPKPMVVILTPLGLEQVGAGAGAGEQEERARAREKEKKQSVRRLVRAQCMVRAVRGFYRTDASCVRGGPGGGDGVVHRRMKVREYGNISTVGCKRVPSMSGLAGPSIHVVCMNECIQTQTRTSAPDGLLLSIPSLMPLRPFVCFLHLRRRRRAPLAYR